MPKLQQPWSRQLQFESLEHRQCMTADAVSIDLNPGGASSDPGVVELNGQHYLAANNGAVGRELFRLNADNSRTLVADIAPGAASSNVDSLTSANGLLYFTVDAPVGSFRYKALVRSDGTAAGTFTLMDHLISFSGNMTPFGNQLYFSANRSDVGDELFKTDGTVSGTLLVQNIDPRYEEHPYTPFDPFDSSPSNLTVFQGQLYFAASFGQRELWKSDGTDEGTRVAVDVSGVRFDSGLQALILHKEQFYFSARIGNVVKLFRSNGKPSGTTAISAGFQSITQSQVANGTLYFVGKNLANGEELWKVPTSGPPVLVKDINPSGSSSPSQLTNANGKLYFTANDGTHGVELWQSDGTAAGTIQVRDTKPGPLSSNPQIMSNLNGTLFFAADDDGTTGRELWQTNGAVSGARLVQDLNPGSASSNPAQMIVSGGQLLFTATKSSIGRELWRLIPGAPVMTLPSLAPTPFTQNGPVRLAPQALLDDLDTNALWGGKLSLTLGTTYQTGDKLLLVPTSNVTLDGSKVLVGGIVMGVFTTGGSGQELTVLFTQYASKSRVREVLRAVAFTNISAAPVVGERRVRFALSDGEGAMASPIIVRVKVQANVT